jgi:hypothetical protein
LIKKQLPIYMARELSLEKETPEDAISQAFQDLDADIQQRFYNLFPKNIKRTHEEDIKAALAKQPDQEKTEAIISEAIHGSCACAVYIKDGVVYAANTGDSRVVSKLSSFSFLLQREYTQTLYLFFKSREPGRSGELEGSTIGGRTITC